MAKISRIEQYKFRIRYLRRFVNHFDANKGYNLNKLKYIEKDEILRRTPQRMQKFYKETPVSEFLTLDQSITVDKYFAFVFPPKTFKDNMRIIRRYTKGFTAKDGFDLRNFFSQPRPKLQKAVEMIRLITELSSRPHKVLRPRKKINLERLQIAAQHEEYPSELIVAFMPAIPNVPMRVNVTKKGVVVREQLGTATYEASFDMFDLLNDPEQEIKRAFNTLPKENYAAYNIQAGKYEVYKVQVGSGGTRSNTLKGLTKRALFYMNKYSAEDFNADDPNSHYYGNWLHGLVAYKSDERAHLANYIVTLDKARTLAKEERKEIYREKGIKRRRAQKLIQTKRKNKAKRKTRK